MNTACIPPCTVIPLHTPWWRRLLTAWTERPARARLPEASRPETWSDPDLRSLRHLSPGTLRDIGAPDWVHEERHAARERALRLMRL
jgi:hypothetical protein